MEQLKGLYQRHKVWWYRFTPAPGARQMRLNLGTESLTEAITRAQDLRRRVEPVARAELESCTAEIERYQQALRREGLARSTIETRGYVLSGAVADMGVESPRYLTRAAVARWFEARLQDHAHTAVAYLNVLHYWLKWLVDNGRLSSDVTADIRRPKLAMQVRKTFLLPDDARRLIAECTDLDVKFALYCALHAGLRKNEVIEARPDWFDLENGLLHVQATPTFSPKGRDNRTIPLTDEFREWLGNVFGLRSPFMLASQVAHGKYKYRYDFRKPFNALVKRLGMSVTFHDLRRTFASLHVSKGTSIYKVAVWLGDDVDVVQDTYGHLIPQDKTINDIWR